jgi:general secretion pathway protein H
MEMMVVVAVVGLLIAAATLSLYNILRSDLRSAASKTAGAMRFAFDKATMTGMTIRLAMDLEKGQVWLEGSEQRVTLGKEGALSEREARPEGEEEEEGGGGSMLPLFGLGGGGGGEDEGDEEGGFQPGIDADQLKKEAEFDLAPVERAAAKFKPIKGMLTKRIKLAKGIRIDGVATPHDRETKEEGMAYVYFFPQGHSEPAIIHLANKNDDYYSVVLHPLTGIARVYPCMYRIPDDFGVSDDERTRRKLEVCENEGGI